MVEWDRDCDPYTWLLAPFRLHGDVQRWEGVCLFCLTATDQASVGRAAEQKWDNHPAGQCVEPMWRTGRTLEGKDQSTSQTHCTLFCLHQESTWLFAILFIIQRLWNGFISSTLRPYLSIVRGSISKSQAWVVKPTTSTVRGKWAYILSEALEPVWTTTEWLTGWPLQALILPTSCPDGAKKYFCYTLVTHP